MSKKAISIFIRLFIFLGPILIVFITYYIVNNDVVKIVDISEINDKIVIKLNKEGKCQIKDSYVFSKNKKCVFDYVDKIDNVYIFNKYNKEYRYSINKEFSTVKSINAKPDLIYLAVGDSKKLDYEVSSKGKINDSVKFLSDNNTIATVDENGVISGLSDGETQIKIKIKDKESIVNVVVTSLIIKRDDEYNYDRDYLKCNMYSKEQNDLLDKILLNRVESVGYKTRASVVEAARFIGLEFPYRIAYFSENGRLHPYGVTSKVDGEGRYYHEGLYLNDSRYEKVSPKMHGPGTWGCPIFSNPSNGYRANGFDCSGFISWIILNGGFDSEDVGAGVSTYKDLTDLGVRIPLSTSISNNSIKAGDLLSGKGEEGGHIALVAGKKDGYYFVAESLWHGTGYFGSLIRKYDVNELKNHFYWHVNMDDFYKEDGNYTEYWK